MLIELSFMFKLGIYYMIWNIKCKSMCFSLYVFVFKIIFLIMCLCFMYILCLIVVGYVFICGINFLVLLVCVENSLVKWKNLFSNLLIK